jgi:hypothetical protein
MRQRAGCTARRKSGVSHDCRAGVVANAAARQEPRPASPSRGEAEWTTPDGSAGASPSQSFDVPLAKFENVIGEKSDGVI